MGAVWNDVTSDSKKNWTNHSSDAVLQFVQDFLNQTLKPQKIGKHLPNSSEIIKKCRTRLGDFFKFFELLRIYEILFMF